MYPVVKPIHRGLRKLENVLSGIRIKVRLIVALGIVVNLQEY